jgi:hypothetical protein
MCQKFERNVERLGNELLPARLFEQWIDDVVARTIGNGGEKEEEVDEDEDEEMKDGVESEVGSEVEEGGDEMEGAKEEDGGKKEEEERIARVASRNR